jgi:hypothetical protein
MEPFGKSSAVAGLRSSGQRAETSNDALAVSSASGSGHRGVTLSVVPVAEVELTTVYSRADVLFAAAVCLPLALSAGWQARRLGRSFIAFFLGSMIATPIAGWLAIFRIRDRGGDPIRVPRLFWAYLASIVLVYALYALVPGATLILSIPGFVFQVSLLIALAAGSRTAWWLALIWGALSLSVAPLLAVGWDPWVAANSVLNLVGILILVAPSMRRRSTEPPRPPLPSPA